ncbi:hypothetical protein SRHO_G00233510 [Serrasalmus rhombeus]
MSDYYGEYADSNPQNPWEWCNNNRTLTENQRKVTVDYEEIRQRVSPALNGLPLETRKKLADTLVSVGVDTPADLQLVMEDDIKEHLKPIKRRQLLNAWKTDD